MLRLVHDLPALAHVIPLFFSLSDNTEIALYTPLNLKERTHCKSSLLR